MVTREATSAPVIGIAEAAFHAASFLATGFSGHGEKFNLGGGHVSGTLPAALCQCLADGAKQGVIQLLAVCGVLQQGIGHRSKAGCRR